MMERDLGQRFLYIYIYIERDGDGFWGKTAAGAVVLEKEKRSRRVVYTLDGSLVSCHVGFDFSSFLLLYPLPSFIYSELFIYLFA